jgi:hypothetical protein
MSAKWYSPRLSREIVSRLYFKAKAERIRMTVLANRIIKQALDAEEVTECRRETGSDAGASREHAGSVKSTIGAR